MCQEGRHCTIGKERLDAKDLRSHPMPYNDRRPGGNKDCCRDKAARLLECLDVPSGKVKRVRVRKIAIDVEMGEDDCGCD